ncbi:hypothetical protein [Brevibacillus sp. FIR094]|uniref:hypothetical protein n=1 Tax=Brevibacillus sp. FIR094 TaxID=3134809 RepID=UPI003D23DCD4
MKILNTVIGAGISLCLGVACSVAYVHFLSNPVVVAAEQESNDKEGKVIKTIEVNEALKQIDFDVKQPGNLPFEPTGSYAQIMEIGENKILEITYVNEDTGEYATVNVSDANIVPFSDEYDLATLKVNDDKESKYMDNRVVQVLYWKDSDLSYSLTLSSGDKGKTKTALQSQESYTPEELKEIAESFD